MKILITGGHTSPALAIIDELKNNPRFNGHSVYFVGKKFDDKKSNKISLEFQEVQKRNVPFYELTAGRLTRIASVKTFVNFAKTPYGFYRAWQVLNNIRPEIVISFGGYIALPIAIMSYFMGIPVFTHEQTMRPGLTNRLIAIIAKKIYVAFDEAKKYFHTSKTKFVGNPIKKSVLSVNNKPFELDKSKPVIYVTGGSLGSHSINIIVEKIIDKLLDRYVVIHQTGVDPIYDDFARLNELRDKLISEKRRNYYLRKHILDQDIGYVFSKTDLVIGRSGANTFFELIALEKPAILIPLPWSANDEQRIQAELFNAAKVGEIFAQDDNPEKLMILVGRMINNLKSYKNNFKNLSKYHKLNASATILAEIFAKN